MNTETLIEALTAAVRAEAALETARRVHWQAQEWMDLGERNHARYKLNAAEHAAEQAFLALADAVADAPASRAKSALVAGALRSLLPGLTPTYTPRCELHRCYEPAAGEFVVPGDYEFVEILPDRSADRSLALCAEDAEHMGARPMSRATEEFEEASII